MVVPIMDKRVAGVKVPVADFAVARRELQDTV